jgi:hypothetical protein
MKALLLYDDKEHATPFLRATEALQDLGITLDAQETHSSESAIRLIEQDVDVVVIHQTIMSDDALDHGKPVVILERIDGTQLAASRKWLASVASTGEAQPSVAAVMKGYCYQEPGRNNTHRGRYHAHMLRQAGIVATGESVATNGLPSPQLSQADLMKIHAGYGFGAYLKMATPRGQMIDFSADREITLHCVCFIDYKGSEIQIHREAALAKAEEWAAACPSHQAVIGGGRPLRPHEYLSTMFRAKIVVSPWGWGEACHRDYEAMLLGAVLVKPSMDHVTCWPDIYRPGETYVPCSMDFSDLGEIVDRICSEWSQWRERREEARRLALEAGDRKRVARRIASILEMVV